MKIFGILKNKFPNNSLVRVGNSNKFIPFENLLVLNFLKFFQNKGFYVERSYIENEIKENKDMSFYKDFDLIVSYSLKSQFLLDIRKINPKILIIEMPYIFRQINKSSKDQIYMRVMWNNHLGNNFISKYSNGYIRKNFNRISLKNYKSFGNGILLINQMENDTAVFPTDPYVWLEDTIYKIRQLTNEKIIIKEHPLQIDKAFKIEQIIEKNDYKNCFLSTKSDINNDLAETRVCVTFSSGSVVDSIIKGVPSFALDKRSCAYEISNNDLNEIDDPLMIDRSNFLSALSNTHWTFDEVTKGNCWEYFDNEFYKKL